MQKFPLRMKDNDLLVTELYKDNTINDHITAISVYLTPKITSKCYAAECIYYNGVSLSGRTREARQREEGSMHNILKKIWRKGGF